jgi:hypothetical protein
MDAIMKWLSIIPTCRAAAVDEALAGDYGLAQPGFFHRAAHLIGILRKIYGVARAHARVEFAKRIRVRGHRKALLRGQPRMVSALRAHLAELREILLENRAAAPRAFEP